MVGIIALKSSDIGLHSFSLPIYPELQGDADIHPPSNH